jgi:hypothetical protein
VRSNKLRTRLKMCFQSLSGVISSSPTCKSMNTRFAKWSYISEDGDSMCLKVNETSADPRLVSPSLAIDTIRIEVFVCWVLMPSSVVWISFECSSPVSFLQSPDIRTARAA